MARNMANDKKCENDPVQRQVMKHAIVTLNSNVIKNKPCFMIRNQCSKNDDLCCNHNNGISANACKKLNIPTNCKLYKNLVNLESMTLPQKSNQLRLKKNKIIEIVKDLEPKVEDYTKLEKYKYLLNPVGEDIYPEIKKRSEIANLKTAHRHQSKFLLKRQSHLIEKIHEWNFLIE